MTALKSLALEILCAQYYCLSLNCVPSSVVDRFYPFRCTFKKQFHYPERKINANIYVWAIARVRDADPNLGGELGGLQPRAPMLFGAPGLY